MVCSWSSGLLFVPCLWDSGLHYISPRLYLTSYAKNKGPVNIQIPYRTNGGFTSRVWFILKNSCMYRKLFEWLFSDLDTRCSLEFKHTLSQKGSKCKQASHMLSCTWESYFLMVSLLTLEYHMLVMGKEIPYLHLFVMTWKPWNVRAREGLGHHQSDPPIVSGALERSLVSGVELGTWSRYLATGRQSWAMLGWTLKRWRSGILWPTIASHLSPPASVPPSIRIPGLWFQVFDIDRGFRPANPCHHSCHTALAVGLEHTHKAPGRHAPLKPTRPVLITFQNTAIVFSLVDVSQPPRTGSGTWKALSKYLLDERKSPFFFLWIN